MQGLCVCGEHYFLKKGAVSSASVWYTQRPLNTSREEKGRYDIHHCGHFDRQAETEAAR